MIHAHVSDENFIFCSLIQPPLLALLDCCSSLTLAYEMKWLVLELGYCPHSTVLFCEFRQLPSPWIVQASRLVQKLGHDPATVVVLYAWPYLECS